MFKELKTRFMLLLMGTVTLLVFVFFGVLYGYIYHRVEQASDQVLDRVFNDMEHMKGEAGIAEEERNPRKFELVFYVDIDEQGNVLNVNSPFNVESDFYKAIVESILLEQKSVNKIKYENVIWKYKIGTYQEYTRIVFMNFSKEKATLYNMIFLFLCALLPLLALIFLISMYFAKRSVDPIEEAFHKQQSFVSDASHELKTPLATIQANINLLMNTASEQQVKWMGYVNEESKRMDNLIKNMLYLTRMEQRQEPSVRINFSEMVEDVCLSEEAVFYEKEIVCESKIAKGLFIYGEEEKIRRLIMILLDNAMKYTDGKIRITLEKEQHYARLAVWNSGQGIEKRELNKIWERFYRTDKARKDNGSFGLGLSIAKAIVKEHKGVIWAQSEVGAWAQFNLKLPLEAGKKTLEKAMR